MDQWTKQITCTQYVGGEEGAGEEGKKQDLLKTTKRLIYDLFY